MTSRWQQYKEKNGSTPLDMLNPNTEKTTNDVQSERISACISCEHFIKMTHQCKKCGCFMDLKTWIKKSKCPIGKW